MLHGCTVPWCLGSQLENLMTEGGNQIGASSLACLVVHAGCQLGLQLRLSFGACFHVPFHVTWVSLRHGSLFFHVVELIRTPQGKCPRKQGRNCLAFYDLSQRITSAILYWLKQSQGHPDSRGEELDLPHDHTVQVTMNKSMWNGWCSYLWKMQSAPANRCKTAVV